MVSWGSVDSTMAAGKSHRGGLGAEGAGIAEQEMEGFMLPHGQCPNLWEAVNTLLEGYGL